MVRSNPPRTPHMGPHSERQDRTRDESRYNSQWTQARVPFEPKEVLEEQNSISYAHNPDLWIQEVVPMPFQFAPQRMPNWQPSLNWRARIPPVIKIAESAEPMEYTEAAKNILSSARLGVGITDEAVLAFCYQYHWCNSSFEELYYKRSTLYSNFVTALHAHIPTEHAWPGRNELDRACFRLAGWATTRIVL